MVRVLGKGGKERLVPFNNSDGDGDSRLSEGSRAAGRGTAARRRRSAATRRDGEPLFVNYRGTRLSTPQHRSAGPPLRGGVQHARRHQPARAAPFVRDPPAAARRRPAGDSGAARPRAAEHDAALHARQRRAAARRLPEGASARRKQSVSRRVRVGESPQPRLRRCRDWRRRRRGGAASGAARRPRGNSMPSVLIL